MKMSSLFPSRFLKAADIGTPKIATIQTVATERIGDDREPKVILSFAETPREFVLNKTNAEAISKIHGDDSDFWIGQKIELFATQVEFQGKLTPAIRVRAPRQAQPVQRPTAPAQPRPQSRPAMPPMPGEAGADDPPVDDTPWPE